MKRVLKQACHACNYLKLCFLDNTNELILEEFSVMNVVTMSHYMVEHTLLLKVSISRQVNLLVNPGKQIYFGGV